MNESSTAVRIAGIRDGMRNLIVIGKITQVGEAQAVTTRFGPARVATATLEDDTGSIRFNLWRDQTRAVSVGDTVKIENAFVKRFRDQLELNVGKDGKITVLK